MGGSAAGRFGSSRLLRRLRRIGAHTASPLQKRRRTGEGVRLRRGRCEWRFFMCLLRVGRGAAGHFGPPAPVVAAAADRDEFDAVASLALVHGCLCGWWGRPAWVLLFFCDAFAQLGGRRCWACSPPALVASATVDWGALVAVRRLCGTTAAVVPRQGAPRAWCRAECCVLEF